MEFQGEVNRKLWLLSPLSTGQRPCVKEQSIVLPLALPTQASLARLSLHTGLSITSHS